MTNEHICPECAAGKCGNCDGRAWDFTKDEPVICVCWQRGHNNERSQAWLEDPAPAGVSSQSPTHVTTVTPHLTLTV